MQFMLSERRVMMTGVMCDHVALNNSLRKTVTPEVDTLQPEGGGLAKKAKFVQTPAL